MCSLLEGPQPWRSWRWNACARGERTILWRLNLCIYDVHQSRRARANAPFSMALRSSRPVMLRQKGERVRYVIDRMTMSDVPRVIEIERLAYPSTWPPSAYRKELQEKPRRPRLFPLSLLPGRPAVTASSPDLASMIGFAGLWLMVDEAHITTIAIHPDYRRRSLGEFLLLSLIDIAYTIGAKWVTLEVRVSNYTAQNLYRKYGFHESGVRHRYYSDNQEDALIMWTEEINSPSYKQKFQALKAELLQKLEAQ